MPADPRRLPAPDPMLEKMKRGVYYPGHHLGPREELDRLVAEGVRERMDVLRSLRTRQRAGLLPGRNEANPETARRRKMKPTASRTERTTAATDVLLSLAALGGIVLLRLPAPSAPWRIHLWSWSFALIAWAAALGATYHGLVLTERSRILLWRILTVNRPSRSAQTDRDPERLRCTAPSRPMDT